MFDFEGDKREFFITQYEFEPFSAIVTFLQEGKLQLHTRNLVPVLDLAQELFVNDLIQLIEKNLISNIAKENLQDSFLFSRLYNMSRLRQELVEFGAKNWMSLHSAQVFSNMNPQDFKEMKDYKEKHFPIKKQY